jgi:hypothetical protein
MLDKAKPSASVTQAGRKFTNAAQEPSLVGIRSYALPALLDAGRRRREIP